MGHERRQGAPRAMRKTRTIVASLVAALLVALVAASAWWLRSDAQVPAIAYSNRATDTDLTSDSPDESDTTDLPEPADLSSDLEPFLEDELEAARRDDSFELSGPAILEALDVVELAPPPPRDPIARAPASLITDATRVPDV